MQRSATRRSAKTSRSVSSPGKGTAAPAGGPTGSPGKTPSSVQASSSRAARYRHAGNEEGARSHGEVADAKVEQLDSRAELPLIRRSSVGRARLVHKRLEGVTNHLLGERPRRVVRARRTAIAGLGHDDTARQPHLGKATQISAQDTHVGGDTVGKRVVVIARTGQPADVVGRAG